jgi:hypothetical protein
VSPRPFLAACLTYAAATTVSYSQQVDFACPKAGTIEQRAVSTLKYTGTSPSDPYICTLINRVGKPELRLFNLFLLSDDNNTAAATGPVRAGILGLLSGRQTNVSFIYTAPGGFLIHETWTLLRKEPLAVDGKNFNTIVFDREMTADAKQQNAFHGHYTLWLDPKTGLWLKSDLTGVSGSTNYYPQAYQIHTLTFP